MVLLDFEKMKAQELIKDSPEIQELAQMILANKYTPTWDKMSCLCALVYFAYLEGVKDGEYSEEDTEE